MTFLPTTAPSAPAAPEMTSPASPLGGPVKIWTDGSCQPNPGAGGWAAILQGPGGDEREISGAEADTTNNRMELRAAIEALKALRRPCRVTVIADSEYVAVGMAVRVPKWLASGWRIASGKPVQNADLWRELLAAAAPHEVEWRWVRGHAGDAMNARVDALADAARERLDRR